MTFTLRHFRLSLIALVAIAGASHLETRTTARIGQGALPDGLKS